VWRSRQHSDGLDGSTPRVIAIGSDAKPPVLPEAFPRNLDRDRLARQISGGRARQRVGTSMAPIALPLPASPTACRSARRSHPRSGLSTAGKPSRQSAPDPTVSRGSSAGRLLQVAAILPRRCGTGEFSNIVDPAQGRIETLPPLRIRWVTSDQPLQHVCRCSPTHHSTVDISLSEKEIPQWQFE